MTEPHLPEQGQQDDLRTVYTAMNDGELLQLASENEELTDAAQAALAAEMERRKLTIPEPEMVSGERMETRSLVTVEKFRDLGPALLAKGMLESSGIDSFLFNENMVRMDWFYSNLIGGITLRVDEADATAAKQILEQPPEDFTPDTEGEYQQPHCPKCQSLDVSEEQLDKPAVFFLMLVASLPTRIRRERWVCNICGAAWVDEPADAPTSP